MNGKETNEYLDRLPLPQALWWFIENVGSTNSSHFQSEVFFRLRERVREHMAEHNRLVATMGERCTEHEPGCPTCAAWALYDSTGRVPSLDEVYAETQRALAQEKP